MLVAEFLERNDLTEAELAEILDRTEQGVKSFRNKPMPQRWLDQLAEATDGPFATEVIDDPLAEGLGAETVVDIDEARERRKEGSAPKKPAGAKVAPLAGLDYTALAGYIEGAYKLGGHTIAGTDPALGAAVESHASAAGQAWAKWVQSEPKVAALLQRMMVGTPLGEVIGVHVSIAFAFFLARGAANAARRSAVESEQHEAAYAASADPLDFAAGEAGS